MSEATLILHRGARPVSLDELAAVKAPPPGGRWFPLSHTAVLSRVKETLGEAGLVVRREQLALSKEDNRFFGVLDLQSELAHGVSLSVGVRNSIDKSFPIGFVAGSRVFVCDNLAFTSELIVRRKHTRFGEQRFAADIAAAMPKLAQFRELEAKRIEAMARTAVSDVAADSLILRAFERGVVTSHQLPLVIRAWRIPEHDEFKPRTLWSLFNAFTTALGPKARSNPQQYAVTTMRLSALVAPTLPALAA
ncbi:MAG: DUF945 domain-containing protein [Gemmataceae bacterium]|nr:DUF945 domain-containing protein [Gemmataceae bacterium]